jgi:drug/metabolite transporter (DMT)-like permease
VFAPSARAAQRSFRASTAAVAYAMEPLFAAAFAVVVVDESLGLVQLVGGALIVAANVLVGLRADDG